MTLYLFISDLEEHAELAEGFERFTDIRPSRSSLAERQIVLVSFAGDSLDAIGRMTHGRKAANYKWHVTLDELVLLDEPLPFETLLAALPPDVARNVGAALVAPGGQLSDSRATVILDANQGAAP